MIRAKQEIARVEIKVATLNANFRTGFASHDQGDGPVMIFAFSNSIQRHSSLTYRFIILARLTGENKEDS